MLQANASQYLGESDAGTRVTLGRYARQRDKGSMEISDEALAGLSSDADYTSSGGIFDFEVHALPTIGQSVHFVIPQLSPIPAQAVYRKFTETHGWSTFIEDSNNQLYSTQGVAGICPAPGDVSWMPGLTAGHWCVQLKIEDGGANDEDGEANGMICYFSSVYWQWVERSGLFPDNTQQCILVLRHGNSLYRLNEN